MSDIKRYTIGDKTAALNRSTLSVPALSHVGVEHNAQPAAYVAPTQFTMTTNEVLISNMGTIQNVEEADFTVQHFCADCTQPFRESQMIKFRGRWWGIPCGDYLHAYDILLKERQRAYQPDRRREPGDVPLIAST